MKVCTITFQNASNFGAALQCVALSNVLKDLDLDTEVINYNPDYIRSKQGAFKEIRKAFIGFKQNHKLINFVRGLIKGVYYTAHYPLLSSRQKYFEEFLNQNIKRSRIYSTFGELENAPPNADVMICGSDQIWNSALTDGSFDKAYFLGFAPQETRKIAYGISFGELNIAKNASELFKLSKDFIAISVRESSAAKDMSIALKQNIPVVLDPTMLMTKEDYLPMEAGVVECAPYLLIYNIQNSMLSTRFAIELAKKKGLRIIDISPNPLKRIKNVQKRIAIGPSEFLSYMKNAEYIVTNSFHGTVFSIIYEKEVFVVPHSSRSNRMVDLLNELEINNRIVYDEEYKVELSDRIDYKNVNKKLQELREESINYLKMAVYK